ncbi:tRNA uridine-5-carboxymethylaminomethyl(34) synthesis GTPase MnmE [Sphingomonas aerophila]|uniref:tRNA modification GTPase MnmE n=1 Tax=Sphingomonas aerophila TaxID=1344948 RepID=A0A7W9BAA4_9SPHN|nr:tRNA modification GTPase [Sphingomonas aerophila]
MADTIFATSSGRPPAAIAIIRISGAGAFDAASRMAGKLPPPRRAGLRQLRHDGVLLDEALVLAFPGPASATGEDLVELHCHGGRAVVAAVERSLSAQSGLRLANAGEFTRRALINGRIDLAEAEGLADLLAAETEAQRVAAMSAAEGRVSRAIQGWIDRVAMLAAQVEAALDFADEDDVEDDPAAMGQVRSGMQLLSDDIEAVLAQPPVDRLRDGIRVVLAGPPNSGKSTLLNRLVEREAAIVSPISGTTRDRIEVAVAHAGLPFLLTDTAGLAGATADPIERIGIARAHRAIEEADLLLWLGDETPPRRDAIWLHARSDAVGRDHVPAGPMLAVAADHPTTIAALWKLLTSRAQDLVPRVDHLALGTTQRRQCHTAALALAEPWADLLIGAEHLRVAHSALAAILGLNSTEHMLDTLFGRFCIGK